MTDAILAAGESPPTPVRPRETNLVWQLLVVAGRALRRLPREPESVLPALVVPVFFYAVNIGQLEFVTAHLAVGGVKAFLLPGAIVFAVTGVSRAATLVSDIERGYFDRLQLTPVRRIALLLGLMTADFLLVALLCIPVLVMGAIVGVHFVTGFAGLVVFIFTAACWGLAFTGFLYAVALATGSPAAVNATFVVFFPFAFLTTAFVPKLYLAGWMSTIATYNPVTYLLAALRSLLTGGWQASSIGWAFVAIGCTGTVSISLCLLALRHRTRPR